MKLTDMDKEDQHRIVTLAMFDSEAARALMFIKTFDYYYAGKKYGYMKFHVREDHSISDQ